MPPSPHGLPGRFVVIEGVDGCGSTTHTKRLTKALREMDIDARLTCEPSTGPIGGTIRQILQNRLVVADRSGPRPFDWATMGLLFAADRLDHLDSEGLPGLEAGKVVVSDRYDLSSLAYQSVTAKDATSVVPWIRELNRRAIRPDLTIVMDVPAAVARERRESRGGDEEIYDSRDLQERLVAVYARAEDLIPGDRVVHIAGDAGVGDVAARVLDAVREILPDTTDS